MKGCVGSKSQQRWLWHAIDHHTGQIFAYVFGTRGDETFLKLKALLAPFGITHFYTDGWGAYRRHIRRDLSGSGLLIMVYKCSLLRELEDRFESQSSASRSGIALGMSPSGVFPQVVDHHLEGATIPRPIAVAQI